jgi:hypothetical protein
MMEGSTRVLAQAPERGRYPQEEWSPAGLVYSYPAGSAYSCLVGSVYSYPAGSAYSCLVEPACSYLSAAGLVCSFLSGEAAYEWVCVWVCELVCVWTGE